MDNGNYFSRLRGVCAGISLLSQTGLDLDKRGFPYLPFEVRVGLQLRSYDEPPVGREPATPGDLVRILLG
jgi:hypothetical protein